VNPLSVRKPVQGGIGSVCPSLQRRHQLKDGQVEQSNFHRLRRLTSPMHRSPIDVHMCRAPGSDRGRRAPVPVIAPAVVTPWQADRKGAIARCARECLSCSWTKSSPSSCRSHTSYMHAEPRSTRLGHYDGRKFFNSVYESGFLGNRQIDAVCATRMPDSVETSRPQSDAAWAPIKSAVTLSTTQRFSFHCRHEHSHHPVCPTSQSTRLVVQRVREPGIDFDPCRGSIW